jgi:type IX secretion system PorP/SprF family membrane protein
MQKIIHTVAAILLFSGFSIAQQLPSAILYHSDMLSLNPAVSGSVDTTFCFNAASRRQWTGFGKHGGPSTDIVSGHANAGQYGIGGYFLHDRNGAVSRTGMQLNYAFHIPMGAGKLGLGLGVFAGQYQVSQKDFHYFEMDDPAISNAVDDAFIYNADFGLLYSTASFNAGISYLRFLNPELKHGKYTYKEGLPGKTLVATGQFRKEISSDIMIEPSLLVILPQSSTLTVDLAIKGIFHQRIWGGLAFRSSGSGAILAGVIWHQMHFGLSTELALGGISSYVKNTHEIHIGWNINTKK